jgi:Tfp pilus assembly protein PilF
MLLEKGNLVDSMESFNRAVKANPDEARAYLGIAKIYSARGKQSVAMENYTKALKLEKDPAKRNQIMNQLFQEGQVGD